MNSVGNKSVLHRVNLLFFVVLRVLSAFTTIRSLPFMHRLPLGLSEKAGALWSLPGIPTVALTRSVLDLLYANVMNFVLLYRMLGKENKGQASR